MSKNDLINCIVIWFNFNKYFLEKVYLYENDAVFE